jgi:uncharacterized protein YbjT (DUF2867 family)
MILVTGATGNVGRPLLDQLRSEGADVRAVTRDAPAAGLPADVDVIEGDPSRPETIASSLRGVTGLFLNPQAVGDASGELLELARKEGVKRVVMLSAQKVDDETQAVEDAVNGSGLECVILRPGMFATNAVILWSDQIRAGDVVRGPYAQAAQAPIDPRDLAGVGAHALLTDDLVGQVPQLTGPQSLTQEEMVIAIGDAIGRPLRYEEIPVEAAKQGMAAFGFPEPVIEAYLDIMAETVGRQAFTTNEVEKILGRPARIFRTWVTDHADVFQAHGG